jgi:hypothetical protein
VAVIDNGPLYRQWSSPLAADDSSLSVDIVAAVVVVVVTMGHCVRRQHRGVTRRRFCHSLFLVNAVLAY